MSDRDYMRIVERLLAKAQATDQPAEAEAFVAKAQRLMAEHAIDEAMLAEAGEREADTVEHRVLVCTAPYVSAKVSLAHGIAEANQCRAVQTGKQGSDQLVTVIGYRVDLDHTEALYASLSLQATRAILHEPDTSRRFRHAFLLAFGGRIGQRLREARQQTEADYEDTRDRSGGSVALVLASRRDRVDDMFRTAFPRIRTRRSRASSATGLRSGDRAGRQADIGHTPLGSRRGLPEG